MREYYEPPDYIKKLQKDIRQYKARSPEEDRGDGFIEGTPKTILDFQDMVQKYYQETHKNNPPNRN